MLWTVRAGPIGAIGVEYYVRVPRMCAPDRAGCHCVEFRVYYRRYETNATTVVRVTKIKALWSQLCCY